MADLGFGDWRRAQLYGHVLLEALSGPWAPLIKRDTGSAFIEICRVLSERETERLMRDPVDLSADDIDWAAVRALAPPMLAMYGDDFRSITGHDLEELRELGQSAIDLRREYRTPRQAISYAIGDCEVVLPTAYFEDRSYVAAVPDEGSWNAVVPMCAARPPRRVPGPTSKALSAYGQADLDRAFGRVDRRAPGLDRRPAASEACSLRPTQVTQIRIWNGAVTTRPPLSSGIQRA
jgi:hypothetical protein